MMNRPINIAMCEILVIQSLNKFVCIANIRPVVK